jgi:hypothetical protein
MRDMKRRIVLGETMAHLTYLASEGLIVEHHGEPSRFQRVT